MQYVVPKPAPPPAQEKPASQSQPSQPQQSQQPAVTPSSPPAQSAAQSPAPPSSKRTPGKAASPAVPALPTKQAASEMETVIENHLYRITFTNRGAQAKSWILKNFKNDKGKPLDMVNPFTAPVLGYPLSLYVYDAGTNKKINEALYISRAAPNS